MQATLSLGTMNTDANNDKINFQGQFSPSRDDLDCVAIFNAENSTFRLELLTGGQATLRHMPGSKRDKDARDMSEDKRVKSIKKDKYRRAQGNASLPAPTAVDSKIRKLAAAVKESQDQEDIADDFFHGALD